MRKKMKSLQTAFLHFYFSTNLCKLYTGLIESTNRDNVQKPWKLKYCDEVFKVKIYLS